MIPALNNKNVIKIKIDQNNINTSNTSNQIQDQFKLKNNGPSKINQVQDAQKKTIYWNMSME